MANTISSRNQVTSQPTPTTTADSSAQSSSSQETIDQEKFAQIIQAIQNFREGLAGSASSPENGGPRGAGTQVHRPTPQPDAGGVNPAGAAGEGAGPVEASGDTQAGHNAGGGPDAGDQQGDAVYRNTQVPTNILLP